MTSHLKKVKLFKPFSNPMLERFSAKWSGNVFTLSQTLLETKPILVLFPEDAEELLDCLRKFLAVSR
jgi:hypothetical protein